MIHLSKMSASTISIPALPGDPWCFVFPFSPEVMLKTLAMETY